MDRDCHKLGVVEVSERITARPNCGVSWSAEVQGSGGCLIRFDVAFPLKRLIAKREDVLQWAMRGDPDRYDGGGSALQLCPKI